jgi:transcriptional regulator with XRE-family HTH domain
MSSQQNPNRIKVVLAERQRTSHWLAVELGKTDMTVSRWCTNKAQPSVTQLVQIARLLDVDVTELLNKTKEL